MSAQDILEEMEQRAIAAAVERCAKIVENEKELPDNDDDFMCHDRNRRLDEIAAKIRSGQ